MRHEAWCMHSALDELQAFGPFLAFCLGWPIRMRMIGTREQQLCVSWSTALPDGRMERRQFYLQPWCIEAYLHAEAPRVLQESLESHPRNRFLLISDPLYFRAHCLAACLSLFLVAVFRETNVAFDHGFPSTIDEGVVRWWSQCAVSVLSGSALSQKEAQLATIHASHRSRSDLHYSFCCTYAKGTGNSLLGPRTHPL